MATTPVSGSVAEIYSNHPLAPILQEALSTAPSPAASEDFRKGFYAALEIVRIQGAAALAQYETKELQPSPLQHAFENFSDGGELSVESREDGEDFQQRPVLKGQWKSVEKPSGLS